MNNRPNERPDFGLTEKISEKADLSDTLVPLSGNSRLCCH
jgi:hypothetical protein